MPPAGHAHGEYALSIGASLRAHAKANGLGRAYAAETGFKLESDPDHVLAPDASFRTQREGRKAARGTPGFFPGPPDVAVEVISPQRSLHRGRREGGRLARRRNARRRGGGSTQPHRQDSPLAGRRRSPGGIGHPPSRRCRSRLANAGQGHIRVANSNRSGGFSNPPSPVTAVECQPPVLHRRRRRQPQRLRGPPHRCAPSSRSATRYPSWSGASRGRALSPILRR